jgi:hypothetical protein
MDSTTKMPTYPRRPKLLAWGMNSRQTIQFSANRRKRVEGKKVFHDFVHG